MKVSDRTTRVVRSRHTLYVNCNIKHVSFIKGSSERSHFIFEINVGKSRIRHRTTLNLNDVIFTRF